MIRQLLENKTPEEITSIKAEEITKIGSIVKTKRDEYYLQVISIEIISRKTSGVEVLVRAWDKDDNQIGFGKDGSVDLERFIIINPPILVPGPLGDVGRTYIDSNNQVVELRYREDLNEALLQVLEQAIKVKKEKFNSEKIIPGKIGTTTSTFFPNASAVDGYVQINNAGGAGGEGVPWASIHDNTDGNDSGTGGTDAEVYLQAGSVENQWHRLSRTFVLFDTSSIGGDGIVSATFSFTSSAKTVGGDFGIGVVGSTPASNTALVNADYDQVGTTRYSTDITISNIVSDSSTYNNYTLNASGRVAVNGSGISKFAVRTAPDIDNVEPAWFSLDVSQVTVLTSEQSGTTIDPKLVVEHLAAKGFLSLLGIGS